MQRRKFIKSTFAAATFAAISPNLSAITATVFTPRPFTREEIEKGVKSLFSENRMDKNAKFGWDKHLINDLGLDSLDTVEVIMDAEQMFHCSITDKIAETINTPRKMADILYKGLNDAVVCYTSPDFKGQAYYLFPEKGAKSEIIYNQADYTKQIVHPLDGAIFKPKNYALTCTIGKESNVYKLAPAGSKWETSNLLQVLEKITKKKASALLGQKVVLTVTT